MTTQDLTLRIVAPPLRLAAAIAGLFRHTSTRRRVLRLGDLDDHLLDDIGLTRDDIDMAAHLPYGQNPAEELVRLSQERRRDRDALLNLRFRV